MSEKSLPCAQRIEAASLGLEDAVQGCRNRRFRLLSRQGYGTPESRILAEEPRPATAAVGTSW